MIFIVEGLLWVIAGWLAWLTFRRHRPRFVPSLKEGTLDFLKLLPRIALGVIGSGYIAALLPGDQVARWLGADSGFTGVLLGTLAGIVTPGGPVIGFSIGVAAWKGGAGAPQVIAYTTAWALYAFQRIFMWELGVMPMRLVWLRLFASLPIPFLAAAGAMLIGRP